MHKEKLYDTHSLFVTLLEQFVHIWLAFPLHFIEFVNILCTNNIFGTLSFNAHKYILRRKHTK